MNFTWSLAKPSIRLGRSAEGDVITTILKVIFTYLSLNSRQVDKIVYCCVLVVHTVCCP